MEEDGGWRRRRRGERGNEGEYGGKMEEGWRVGLLRRARQWR